MKRFMLVVIVIACSFRFAASQAPVATHQVSVGSVVTKEGRKISIGSVVIRGNRASSKEHTIECHGMCEMATSGFLLRADDLEFNPDTGEVSAPRNARLSFVGAIPQHGQN